MTAFHPFQAGYTFWSFVQTVQTLIRRRHRRRKVLNIWGGKVLNMGGGGANFFAGCKLIGASAPNQCQKITFLTLKTDNIAKLRIELKSILSEISSNKKIK